MLSAVFVSASMSSLKVKETKGVNTDETEQKAVPPGNPRGFFCGIWLGFYASISTSKIAVLEETKRLEVLRSENFFTVISLGATTGYFAS